MLKLTFESFNLGQNQTHNMKKIFRIHLGMFIVIILNIIIKTISFRSMQIEVEPASLPIIGIELILASISFSGLSE